MDKSELALLIRKQLKPFRKRPLIKDEEALIKDLPGILDAMRASDDDFSWSLCFMPRFYMRLLWEGFLPICCNKGDGLFVLLPKMHATRCVMSSVELAKLAPGKSARKRARRFRLTRNAAFDEVIAGCIEQHGHSWLWPPMKALLQRSFASPALAAPLDAVHVTSWEVWEGTSLVAGELGVLVGRRYTSFTGFARVSGAGMIQLLATGTLLHRSGAELWDLGQPYEYKSKLGAVSMSQDGFLTADRAARGDGGGVPVMQLPDTVEDLNGLFSQ